VTARWSFLGALATVLLAAGAYWYALEHQDNAALAQRWTESGHSIQALASKVDDLPFTPERLSNLRSAYLKLLDFNPGFALADWRMLNDVREKASDIGQPHHHFVTGISSVGLEMTAGKFFRHALDLDPGNASAKLALRDTVQLLLAQARLDELTDVPAGAAALYEIVLEIDPGNEAARSRKAAPATQLVRDAEILIQHGAIREATALLRATRGLDPSNSDAIALLPRIVHLVVEDAQRDIDAGDLLSEEGALGALKQVRALDPDGAETKQLAKTLADGVAEIGDGQLMLQINDDQLGDPMMFYHQALEIDPDNARANQGIAAVLLYWDVDGYIKNGSAADAKNALEAAAAQNSALPGLVELRQMVARVSPY